MVKSSKGPISSFFRPLLRFLGMASEPSTGWDFELLHNQVPETPAYVAKWKSTFEANCCILSDSSYHLRQRLGIQKILEIRRFKSNNLPYYHESLVALLEAHDQPDPERSTHKYILIERDVDCETPITEPDPDHEGQWKLRWKAAARTKSGELKRMANGKTDADDLVKLVGGWPTDELELSRLLYPTTEPGPTLVDLIVAAYVTHNSHSKYNLFRRQCYWYAATVADVLESEFQPRRLRQRYDAALKQSSEDSAKCSDQQFHPKDGSWINFNIHKVQPGLVAEIHQEFLKERYILTKNISDATEKALAQVRAREEAERMAEADREAREEAERKAEVAERRAEADREAREVAERKAEADREAREDAERKAKEADARIAELEALLKLQHGIQSSKV